jgi:hypothetical protein
MSRIIAKLTGSLVAGGVFAALSVGLIAGAGPAAATNGVDGQTMTVCTSAPNGLAFRSAPSPDAAVDDHLENGWHFQVQYHAANGMLYGYSPILNRHDYVDDGHFC